MEEDLRAARGGPWGTRVDDSPRGRAIAFQYEEYERLVYRPNHVVSARNLTDVVVDNVGGNEWDARRREKIQPKVLAGWLRFLAEKEDFSAELMEINEDGLSLRLDETRQALKKQLGEGVRRRDVRSLDADPPEARAQLRSDRPRPDTHAVLEEASAVARDLRDLRDARDLAELHPHLNVLVEGALRSPEQLFGFMPWLRALLKRFEVQDAATQAAMIFELGCGPGRKPRWTRENVARHYAVTPRQVSYRGQLARKLIPQLPAA
jgi:hypothetical protein